MTGRQSVPLIGTVHYNVTNIVLKNVHVVLPQLTILPNYGVFLKIERVTGLVEFQFSYTNRGMWRGSGRGRVNLRRMSFEMKMGISVLDGFPQASTRDVRFRIHDWSLDLNGPGWFVQMLKNLFSGTIRSNIERGVVSGINDAVVKQVNPELRKLPLRQSVEKTDLGVDVRLLTPSIQEGYVSIPTRSAVYNFKTNEQPTVPRRVIPDIINENKMIYILLSDFVPNSAGEMAFKTGLLHVNATDETLPQWSPVRLNSSALVSFIPNLQQHFPNRKLMVQTLASEAPRADFDDKGLKISLRAIQKWYAIVPNTKTLKHAFTLDVIADFAAQIYFKDNKICGNVPSMSIKLSVKESNVGEIRTIALFQDMINFSVNYILLPGANIVLNQGYPLPELYGFRLHKPSFKFENHFFSVSSDLCGSVLGTANITCPAA